MSTTEKASTPHTKAETTTSASQPKAKKAQAKVVRTDNSKDGYLAARRAQRAKH
jgi:hypothetical protein